MEPTLYVDTGKRGRIAILAFLSSISVFLIRAVEFVDISENWHLMAFTASHFLLIYLGLLWALRFQVTKKSLLLVIPQSALFASMQALFVILYFSRHFVRVYEFLLLFVLIALTTVSTYISFLMTNIFNVATFKVIPLEQVAKTTSYIITLLSVYFATFNLLTTGVRAYYIVPILFLVYILIVLMHLIHMGFSLREMILTLATIAFLLVSLSSVAFFLSPRHEVTALMPTTALLAIIGIEMNRAKTSLKWYNMLQYYGIFLFSLIVNFYFLFTL